MPPKREKRVETKNESEKDEEETNAKLIAWECFGLAAEEHVHAKTLYQRNKNGKPMGHR